MFAELGTGPLRLAMAHRVQHARSLLETTDLPVTDVAWAAGFGSVRQFNDRIRDVYALSPTELRRRSSRNRPRSGNEGTTGTIRARLAYRPPLDLPSLLWFLGQRAVPGVEFYDASEYSRVLRLPHGLATVSITGSLVDGPRPFVSCELQLDDVRDYGAAISSGTPSSSTSTPGSGGRRRGVPRSRPAARATDPGPNPACGLPGSVDGPELAMRAIPSASRSRWPGPGPWPAD